jgi:cytochrome oxidase Cu insertion factor (SCO1/SenC/PrrC family)
MNSEQPYQPSERDPKAIRLTVIILFLLMLVGGFFIVFKYKEKMGDEIVEIEKGRSAMSVGNVRKNFQTVSIDNTVYDFTILEGKVTLMTVISTYLPEESERIVAEMKKAEERFSGNDDLQFVCISADPISEVPLEKLKDFATQLGIVKSNWYVLASDAESFGGYVKNGLKLGMVSRIDKETDKRALPDFLRIVDPSLKIRGEIDDFKFLFYHAIEAKTQLEIEADPGLLENENVKESLDRYQNVVSIKREKMYKYINYIFNHEEVDVEALKLANRSNRYHIPLIILSGFVLFILIMGYRLKRQRKKEEIINKRNK